MGGEILPAIVHLGSEVVGTQVLRLEAMYQVVVTEFFAPRHLLGVATGCVTSCIAADRAVEVPEGEEEFLLFADVSHTKIVVFLLIVQELERLYEKDEINDILLVEHILILGFELRLVGTQQVDNIADGVEECLTDSILGVFLLPPVCPL